MIIVGCDLHARRLAHTPRRAASGCPFHAQHEWGFPLSWCQPRTFPQARLRLSIDWPVLVCYYAFKSWVSLAAMLLPAGPEHPLFDN